MLPLILAFICPPAAVALVGKPSQTVTNLGLTLFLFVPGVVHALGVLQKQRILQRNELLMNIASRYYG